MTNTYLLSACLMLHLMALVVFAGTTFVDYLANISFFKTLGQSEQPSSLLTMMGKLPRVAGIGASVLILSGFGMMTLTHGIFGKQLWFRIKFGLVVLIILNSLLFGRRQSTRLRRLLSAGEPMPRIGFHHIKNRLSIFYLLQLFLFTLIIFLSAFKFN